MITMIIDGQWGSTGKGRLAAYMVSRKDEFRISAAVTDCGPNAGHTAVWNGRKVCTHQLPIAAFVDDEIPIFIGPGAIINRATLQEELSQIANPRRVKIHDRAAVVNEEDITKERSEMCHIASTMTGTGEAWKHKLSRQKFGVAGDYQSLWAHCVTDEAMRQNLRLHTNDGNLLIESSQGFGLSIDHGFYPYTTHRNITPNAILDRCAIPTLIREADIEIWASFRTYPIRVGNVAEGSSGPHWPDQRELTWEELGQKPEFTSTTNRVRRVFSWSAYQYTNFLRAVQPTHVSFSFLDYIPEEQRQRWMLDRLERWDVVMRELEGAVEDGDYMPCRVLYSTGPDVNEVHELTDY